MFSVSAFTVPPGLVALWWSLRRRETLAYCSCHRIDNDLPPEVHAACTGFPQVYIHPFSDGNGRVGPSLLQLQTFVGLESWTAELVPPPVRAAMTVVFWDVVLELVRNTPREPITAPPGPRGASEYGVCRDRSQKTRNPLWGVKKLP